MYAHNIERKEIVEIKQRKRNGKLKKRIMFVWVCIESGKRKKMENVGRKWGFGLKPSFSENIDLLPAASGDGFVLVPGVDEQAGCSALR